MGQWKSESKNTPRKDCVLPKPREEKTNSTSSELGSANQVEFLRKRVDNSETQNSYRNL